MEASPKKGKKNLSSLVCITKVNWLSPSKSLVNLDISDLMSKEALASA